MFRVFASLPLAIGLLSLFTICLAAATFIESAYSGAIAQELVYHTWWFTLLLFLLAINVLCAALKKMDPQRLRQWAWPWKRHQTGFLITHCGLLLLVFGGLLTALGGSEGQMVMIDSENKEIQDWARLPNKSSTMLLSNQQRLEVYHIPRAKFQDNHKLHDLMRAISSGGDLAKQAAEQLDGDYWRIGFDPGSFPWYADQHFNPDTPWTLWALHCLASPFRGFSRDLHGQGTLRVENFYPHTAYWPCSHAQDQEKTFPALQLRLTSAMVGKGFDRWITGMPILQRETSPVALEMMLLNEPALLQEFLSPPEGKDMGPDGQLVLLLGTPRQTYRIPVDRAKLGEPIELPGTGLKLKLTRCTDLLELFGDGEAGNGPKYHTVQFELSGHGTGEYAACARFPNLPPFRRGKCDVERLAVWYHHPDFRWGNTQLMGSVQFLCAPDGKLHYRVYGKDGLREKGKELDPTDTTQVHMLPFKPMEMRFQVTAWLPQAADRPSFVPQQVRPGAEVPPTLEPALRCSLSVGDKKTTFQVRLSRSATQVQVGDEMFFVRYGLDDRPVDFELTLKQAQQVSDPGTSRAASYRSDVVLSHEQHGQRVSSEHTISMNNTLDFGAYKIYQANYRPLTNPETMQLILDTQGKLVSFSGLTVAHDPGLYFKYAGSVLLVLGIAIMFWMKAYFFKRSAASPLAA